MSALTALLHREILRFVRQRSRWIGALATPLLFWLLVGTGLGSSFQDPGSGRVGYLEFFFPGALLLSVLFTSIFSTISVIEDRDKGFLQAVLVSPQSSSILVASKVLSGALLGTLQGVLLMGLIFFLPYQAPLMGVLLGILLLFVMALCLTSVAFFFAWKSSSVSGFHGVMNMVLMPMWILSGSVFPVLGAESFLSKIALLNPLTWGLSSFKLLIGGQSIGFVDLALGFVYPLIVTVIFAFLSTKSITKRRGA
jgi:ABC-2 type transport system permease protein